MLGEKLLNILTKVTRHAKYVTFPLAEVAVTWNLFAAILDRIGRLWREAAQNPCWPLKNDSLGGDSRIPARDGQQKWKKSPR